MQIEIDEIDVAEEIEIEDAPAQLATISTVFDGVPMMDEAEARAVVTRIKTRIDITRGELLELHDREGWRALGYGSWGACVKAEFEGSSTALYRQLAAAKIEREVFGDSRIGNPVPASQLEAVKDLPTEEKRAAFQRADELAGDQPRTAKHITQAVVEITPPAESDLPPDYAIVKRRLDAHGVALLSNMQGHHRAFVTRRDGMTGVVTFDWEDVLSKLERLEAEPSSKESDVAFRLTCPTCGETILNGIWGDLKECGGCYHARQKRVLSPETSVYDQMTVLCEAHDWAGAQALIDGLPGGALSVLKDFTAQLARARESVAPAPAGWACEQCGTRITDMRKPSMPPLICTSCAMRNQADRDRALRPASATVAAYESQERADHEILAEATGMLSAARALLSSVQVEQRAGAGLDRAIVHEQAHAFELVQRERLTRFSVAAMVSQATLIQALDHIRAQREVTD